jgi:hypothetical protein
MIYDFILSCFFSGWFGVAAAVYQKQQHEKWCKVDLFHKFLPGLSEYKNFILHFN